MEYELSEPAEQEAVFVDTSYFVAFFNPSDSLHSLAQERSALLTVGHPLIISSLIFSETVTIVSQRVGKLAAIDVGRYLLSSSTFSMVHVDEELQRESWRIFQEIDRKDVSFVDCSILAVMRAEGVHALLTFDQKDFKPLRSKFRFKFFGAGRNDPP